MSYHIAHGLTVAEASRICLSQCKAGCCRGPLILELTAVEVETFKKIAAERGETLQVSRREDNSGWLKFSDYPEERCPMLEPSTSACRIYSIRPRRCRQFPERKTPGCAVSGG